MLSSDYAKVSLSIHVLVLGWVLLRGDRHARMAAVIVAVASTAAMLVQDQSYRGADVNLLAVEAVQCVALTTLTFISRRNWTAVMAGLSLLTVMLHLGKGLDDGVATFPYLTLVVGTGYASLATLLFASFRPKASY